MNLLAKTGTDIIIGTHDSIVSSSIHWSLKDTVHLSLSPCDILLVIWGIIGKSSPSVLWGLLLLIIVNFCRNLETTRQTLLAGNRRTCFLKVCSEKCWICHRSTIARTIPFQLHTILQILSSPQLTMNFKLKENQHIYFHGYRLRAKVLKKWFAFAVYAAISRFLSPQS